MKATIIISVLLVICISAAVYKIIKDKKSGRGCSSACSSCAMKDKCHKNKTDI